MRKVVYECDFCGTLGDKRDMRKLRAQRAKNSPGSKVRSQTLGDICDECVSYAMKQAAMDKNELKEQAADMFRRMFNPTGDELVERVGI